MTKSTIRQKFSRILKLRLKKKSFLKYVYFDLAMDVRPHLTKSFDLLPHEIVLDKLSALLLVSLLFDFTFLFILSQETGNSKFKLLFYNYRAIFVPQNYILSTLTFQKYVNHGSGIKTILVYIFGHLHWFSSLCPQHSMLTT